MSSKYFCINLGASGDKTAIKKSKNWKYVKFPMQEIQHNFLLNFLASERVVNIFL